MVTVVMVVVIMKVTDCNNHLPVTTTTNTVHFLNHKTHFSFYGLLTPAFSVNSNVRAITTSSYLLKSVLNLLLYQSVLIVHYPKYDE